MRYLLEAGFYFQSIYSTLEVINLDVQGAPFFEVDSIKKKVTLNLTLDTTYEQLSNYVVIPEESSLEPTDLVSIQSGIYTLLNPIEFNGFKLILSTEALSCSIQQYRISDVSEPSILLDISTLTIIVPVSITKTEYIKLINESNYMYVLNSTDDAVISNIHLLQQVKENKIDIVSTNMVNINRSSLLIETADYISALIDELSEDYPNVQFYNMTSDKNEKKYQEFCFYKANPEGYSSELITTPIQSDPVYGQVLRTTCIVQFEYHCNDISVFNKRKFDANISRFITDKVTATLIMPETNPVRSFPFSVHWKRDELLGDQELAKNQSLAPIDSSQLSFRITAVLTCTIYRLSAIYPRVLQVIVKPTHVVPLSVSIDKYHKYINEVI